MAFINPYIFGALESGPAIIDRLIHRLPASKLDDRPDPDRFTVREVICHLADWEPFFLERLKGAVTEDNFQIVAYDEGQLAIENGYATQDVGAAIERYKAGRKQYIAYAASLSEADLDRPAYHPERGHLTAADLIDIVVGHDVYHVDQLSAR